MGEWPYGAGEAAPAAARRLCRLVSTSSPVTAAELDRLTGCLRGRGYRVEFDLRGQQPVLRYLEDLVLPGR